MAGARNEIVWRPDAATVAGANLTRFMQQWRIADYDALVARADAEPEWFWDAVINHFGLRFATPYQQVMECSAGIPWTSWCIGGTTNAVLNCLDRHRGTPLWQQSAIEWEGEDGRRRAWSFAELDAETCRLASALRALGLGQGDVIAIYMPMLPETAAAFLAIVKIGAIALPLFSGFGASAIAARCNDAGARAIIAADGTMRRGRTVAMKVALDDAAAEIPTLEQVIVLDHLHFDAPMMPGRDHWWHDVITGQPERTATTILPADDPLMVIYTSGTTGRAKGTVHTHCGFPTKLALDLGLCMDVRRGERLLWMSDMGWLVGPILVVGATMLGATIVMAEGAPDHPDKGRMWRLVEEFGVTFLGLAPTIVRSLMVYGAGEVRKHDLSSLRIIASTGEPWNPDSWRWCFDNVGGGRVPLINYSGGTEIGGGILCGTVLHPLKPCAFTGPIPGMGADVVDAAGRSVPRGEVGELVLRRPSIGLSRGLWRDDTRYLKSYWQKIPGLWVQGDFASIDQDGFWYLHGRSDDTIMIAGKRVGPAEVESLLLATGRVREAAAIGVPDPVKGEAVVCVCVPDGQMVADELADAVVRGLGAPFRPREILFARDLPKTRNMKIMRRVVRAIYTGQDPGDLSSLVNPEAVTSLRDLLAR